jgi:arsenite/tail-anchored protein-transporting ATPase
LVNRILPNEMDDSYMGRWKEIQKDYNRLIEESFSSSRIFKAKLFDREMLGLERLDEFGRHIFGDANPAEIFCGAKPMTIVKEGGEYFLSWHIPGVKKDEIDLWVKGEDLILKTPKYMRNMVLPAVLEGKKISGAVFKNDYLKITFAGQKP